MLFNGGVQMVVSLTNKTRFTSCTSKVINNIKLNRFRYGVLTTEKTTKFYWQKCNLNVNVFTKTFKNMS